MTYDSGFAPNPFWGVLTLAACTPNHRRARLVKGDWIIGIESNDLKKRRKKAGLCPDKENLVVYVAKVDEILDLDSYFRDSRFADKKYDQNGGWKKRRGDNVYYKDNGIWKWIRGHEHDGKQCSFFPPSKTSNCELIDKDIKGNKVFICSEFSYFADACVEFDRRLSSCIVKGRGFKYCHPTDSLYHDFINYIINLMKRYGTGEVGTPLLCTIGERKCKEQEVHKTSCKG